MLTLITKWPLIQIKCIEIQPQCFQAQKFNQIGNNIDVITLSTIIERSEDSQSSLKVNQETYTDFSTSVHTQSLQNHKITRDSQTHTDDMQQSKKTSTASLLTYIQNGGLHTPEVNSSNLEVISNNSLKSSKNDELIDIEDDKDIKQTDSSEEDNITSKNLETMIKIPSSVNLNNLDDKHDDYTASDPLYADCKPRKYFLKFSRQINGIMLLKQINKIKDLTFLTRIKSEELMQNHPKYEKLPNKPSATF